MINSVTLIGNIGADPEIRVLDSGFKVARMRLATTERYKDKDGSPVEQTEWHTVEAWRGLADVVDRYVRKGDRLYIRGSIYYREYTDKEGITRMGVSIRAVELKMLSPKNGQQAAPAASATPAASPYQSEMAAPPVSPRDDIDDLPF